MKKIFAALIITFLLSGCVCMQNRTNLSSSSYPSMLRLPTSATLLSQTMSTPTATICTMPATIPTAPPTDPSVPTTVLKPDYTTVTYIPKSENDGKTYTGLSALPLLQYQVIDPENMRQLSVTRMDHAFGVASGGKPHVITVDNQKRFEQWGTGALAWDNITQEKVLYLTFDCGYEYQNRTSAILDVLEEKKVPATFFVTMNYLRSSPATVARMILEGHHVGNHSQTHPANCAALTREQMALEALAVENHLRQNFGYTSQYFRFPAGVYSQNTVELLASVGYRSIFWSIAYADWDPEKPIGEEQAFAILTQRLHPGAVILLHTISADNLNLLGAFIDYAVSQGYRFADLDEYYG